MAKTLTVTRTRHGKNWTLTIRGSDKAAFDVLTSYISSFRTQGFRIMNGADPLAGTNGGEIKRAELPEV